jgi:hypothetical protein
MGICEVLSAPRSLWQRAYVEPVIGSVRRECLDHVIVFHESSLRRILTSYFDYSPIEDASFVGEGLTGATGDSTSGNGIRRGGAAGQRTAPPLRTTGCLKESESITLCTTSRFGPLQFASDLYSVDTLASCELCSIADFKGILLG